MHEIMPKYEIFSHLAASSDKIEQIHQKNAEAIQFSCFSIFFYLNFFIQSPNASQTLGRVNSKFNVSVKGAFNSIKLCASKQSNIATLCVSNKTLAKRKP